MNTNEQENIKNLLHPYLIKDLINMILEYLNPIFKDEYYEQEIWREKIKNLNNISYYTYSNDNSDDRRNFLKQNEDKIKVGDIFITDFINNYNTYHSLAIVKRMTKKMIFYKILKEKKISGWFNIKDWGHSEKLFKFNIKNIYDMKEKRVKKQRLEIINKDKINLNDDFYYVGGWRSNICSYEE